MTGRCNGPKTGRRDGSSWGFSIRLLPDQPVVYVGTLRILGSLHPALDVDVTHLLAGEERVVLQYDVVRVPDDHSQLVTAPTHAHTRHSIHASHDYITPPGRGAKYCDQRVCLSVRSHSSETTSFWAMRAERQTDRPTVQTSWDFLYMLSVTVARSSSGDDAIRYVLPVLWMTLRFQIMGQTQMRNWSLRRSELFTVTRQVASLNCAPESEVCYLQLTAESHR